MKIIAKSLLSVAAASASLFAASSAFAADPGQWYGGLSVGQSHNSFDTSNFSLSDPTVGESRDETDTGYKGYVGYQFTPYFGLEGGYTNFGKFHYNYNGSSVNPGSASAEYKPDSWHVEGVGTMPLQNGFSLFGKLGVSRTKVTDNFDSSFATIPSGSADTNTTRPLVGVGLNYDISRNVAVRAEYEDYGRVGNDDSGHARLNLTSVGLKYSF